MRGHIVPRTPGKLHDDERLALGVGTVTIHLDVRPAQETLRHIADQIDEGMTSGFYPEWEVSE